jgi:ABC-type glycerol-3-phosphate transport system substrate-binding protein
MKFTASLAIVVVIAVAGCGGGESQSSTAQSTTPTTPSISQLQREAAAQHEVAQNYLQQTMQITRDAYNKGEEYLSNEEHQKAASLIRLQRAAQRRAAGLHAQMCDLVLRDPRTPHSDRLGMIALSCE